MHTEQYKWAKRNYVFTHILQAAILSHYLSSRIKSTQVEIKKILVSQEAVHKYRPINREPPRTCGDHFICSYSPTLEFDGAILV